MIIEFSLNESEVSGSLSHHWIESKTTLICRAELKLFLIISKLILPRKSIFRCYILFIKIHFGWIIGYSSGKYNWRWNWPPLFGLTFGPVITRLN
jgi:hypothetical protein